MREIEEELGCLVAVERWLDGAVPIGDDAPAHASRWRGSSRASPCRTSTTPCAGWRADELDDVDWLEPDRPFLAELAALMRVSA